MKKTNKMTFAAIMAAVAAALMLVSWFPYLTYAIPAMSGLFIMVTVIEINYKWAIGSYLASLLPVMLWAEKESMVLYVLFFGYYPLIKALTESIRNRVAEWVIKLVVFNAAVIAVYAALKALGLPLDDFYIPGINLSLQTVMWLFLLAGNVVFVLYDIALTRALPFYFSRIQPMIYRILK